MSEHPPVTERDPMLFDPDEDHLCAFCDDRRPTTCNLANSELWACDHHFQLVVAGENDRAQIELLTGAPRHAQ